MTKRRYMRLLGLGVWGRGGVTMRLLGVETSIKTTKNTTRTSTIITLQQQKHFKNECNQTNKQRSKKQGAKKETNKHTNNQQKNKHTNRQRTNRHNTSSTNNKSNLADTQQQEELPQQEDDLGPTCFRRACADDPTAYTPQQQPQFWVRARARETRTSTSIVYARAREPSNHSGTRATR